jgi:AraC-like DNA-binding protein
MRGYSWFQLMPIEQHLILQKSTQLPSDEWMPNSLCWTTVRVAEGYGYCFQAGVAREMKSGDAIIISPHAGVTLRASQLCELKLDFFLVMPQHLNSLITVAEWRQLEKVSHSPSPRIIHYAANEAFAQKFARLAALSQSESLSVRSALLQLWASSITSLLSASGGPMVGRNKLLARFRQLVGKMPEQEMATQSLTELAAQLHCSERHFSRLFREEFGVPLRKRQTELRLLRARQLLADNNAKISSVAYESGYRHLGLFNIMFKKRFGMSPKMWRQQNSSMPPTGKLKNVGSLSAPDSVTPNVVIGKSAGLPSSQGFSK